MTKLFKKIIPGTLILISFFGLLSFSNKANAQYYGVYGYGDAYANAGFNFGFGTGYSDPYSSYYNNYYPSYYGNYYDSYYPISYYPTTPVVSQRPIWNNIYDQQTQVGSTLNFTVTAYDPSSMNPVIYSAISLPSGASFNPSTRVFTWSPSNSGTYSAVFRATTCTNCYSDLEVAITVAPRPQPIPTPSYPTNNTCYPWNSCYYNTTPITSVITTPQNTCSPSIFGNLNRFQAKEGIAFTTTITPLTPNRQLQYRVIDGPSGLSINNSGNIYFVPNFSQGGTSYNVKLGASNGCREDYITITIDVEDAKFNIPQEKEKIVYIKESTTKKEVIKKNNIDCSRCALNNYQNNSEEVDEENNSSINIPTTSTNLFISFLNSLFCSPILLIIVLILMWMVYSLKRQIKDQENWNRLDANYKKAKEDLNSDSNFPNLPRP